MYTPTSPSFSMFFNGAPSSLFVAYLVNDEECEKEEIGNCVLASEFFASAVIVGA